jgi:hypothetical protein
LGEDLQNFQHHNLEERKKMGMEKINSSNSIFQDKKLFKKPFSGIFC